MEGKSGEIGFLLSPEIGEPLNIYILYYIILYYIIYKILLVEPFKTIGQATVNRVVRNIYNIFLRSATQPGTREASLFFKY